jgi:hypothetical protein
MNYWITAGRVVVVTGAAILGNLHGRYVAEQHKSQNGQNMPNASNATNAPIDSNAFNRNHDENMLQKAELHHITQDGFW